MYTLDTNTIIYYLGNDLRVVPVLENIILKSQPIFISTISEVELFSFSRLTTEEADQIENMLETFSIISLDSQLARIAGFIRRKYKIKTPDSIVAATAMFTDSTLVTRNIKDFEKIGNLKVLEI